MPYCSRFESDSFKNFSVSEKFRIRILAENVRHIILEDVSVFQIFLPIPIDARVFFYWSAGKKNLSIGV